MHGMRSKSIGWLDNNRLLDDDRFTSDTKSDITEMGPTSCHETDEQLKKQPTTGQAKDRDLTHRKGKRSRSHVIWISML